MVSRIAIAFERMPIIVDENTSPTVGEVFRARGHEIHTLKRGLSDEAIAQIGDLIGAVIITADRDFERLIPRVPVGARRRYRNLGRISLLCRAQHARARIEQLIDSIEFEYALAQQHRDRRLIIEIAETSFRVIR